MTKAKTIAITGATGFIGRCVVQELLSRGWTVRALVRTVEKAHEVLAEGRPSTLASRGVELVVGDVCDPDAAARLVSGADACVNLVGIIREVRGQSRRDLPQTFDRMHVRATETLVSACEHAGVRRFVQMSALGVGPEGTCKYQRTKWDGECIVRRSGLDWTILRPSLVHGPHSEFIGMLSDIVSGEQAPWVFIPYFVRIEFDDRLPIHVAPTRMVPAKVQPVAVEDVAKAIGEALETGNAVGEVYNLTGPDMLDWQELSEYVRDTIPSGNKRLGTWYIPGLHASCIAKAASMIGLGGLLPFDDGQALMATQDSLADSTKAAKELGFSPVGFREGLKRYAAMV